MNFAPISITISPVIISRISMTNILIRNGYTQVEQLPVDAVEVNACGVARPWTGQTHCKGSKCTVWQDPGKYTKGTDPNLDKILGFLGQIPQVWLDKKICGKIRHQKT